MWCLFLYVSFLRQMAQGRDAAYATASKVMVDNLALRDGQEGIRAFIEKRKPVWSHKAEKAHDWLSFSNEWVFYNDHVINIDRNTWLALTGELSNYHQPSVNVSAVLFHVLWGFPPVHHS